MAKKVRRKKQRFTSQFKGEWQEKKPENKTQITGLERCMGI